MGRKMSSLDMKSWLLSYLRYGRQFPIVATEFGDGRADVIGVRSRYLWEIEVKISISDLRAEENKQKKHERFLAAEYYSNRFNRLLPNDFSFAVPVEISAKAKEIIEEEFPYAGLLEVGVNCTNWGVMVLKKPQRLHTKRLTARNLGYIVRGQSASLACAYRRITEMRRAVESLREMKATNNE